MIKAKTVGLPLGLHLNLSEGVPVSDPSSIPSLLVSSESIPQFRGKEGFIQAEKEGVIQVNDVEYELRAQVFVCIHLFHSWSALLRSLDTSQTTWMVISMFTCIRV